LCDVGIGDTGDLNYGKNVTERTSVWSFYILSIEEDLEAGVMETMTFHYRQVIWDSGITLIYIYFSPAIKERERERERDAVLVLH